MKPVLRSRTLWVNYLVVWAAVAVELVPALQVYFPDHATRVTAAVAAVNIVLRHLTTEPVSPILERRPEPPNT